VRPKTAIKRKVQIEDNDVSIIKLLREVIHTHHNSPLVKLTPKPRMKRHTRTISLKSSATVKYKIPVQPDPTDVHSLNNSVEDFVSREIYND